MHDHALDSGASCGMQPLVFILGDIDEEDVDDAESEWISNNWLFILYSWQSC